ANVEATETFYLQNPTASLSNFGNGRSYFIDDVSVLATGRQSGLFSSADTNNGPYFEVTLTPLPGQTVSTGALAKEALTVSGVSGITINSVSQPDTVHSPN